MENKLNFLMNLTGTKNSVLSKAVSFDPSYISRIRTGKRSMPDTPQFVEALASYFSRNIRPGEQQVILASELCPGKALPEDREELQMLLSAWLHQKELPKPDSIHSFLNGFASAGMLAANAARAVTPDMSPEELDAAIRNRTEQLETEAAGNPFYYGNEGKRRAVEIFLGRLCCSNKAYQLLLYSDEEMSWLYEDPAFAKRWAALLIRLLSTGSRIRIPHNITRDSNEMFESVQKWIPLYMTGAIEPLYYPRLRDGVYHRSLFIAKDDSALISTSVGRNTDGMLNIQIRDRQAVQALEQEYANYTSLCLPLMHIYSKKNSRDCFQAMLQYEKQPGDVIFAHPLPALFTMPQSVTQSVRLRSASGFFSEYQGKSYAIFREHMRKGERVIEILNLPNAKDVKDGLVRFPLEDFFELGPEPVSAAELKLHLKNVIRLLRREPSYQVILSGMIPKNICLSAKENTGAHLMSALAPTTNFEIREHNMTAAFWEYLCRIMEDDNSHSREDVLRQLDAYIRELDG